MSQTPTEPTGTEDTAATAQAQAAAEPRADATAAAATEQPGAGAGNAASASAPAPGDRRRSPWLVGAAFGVALLLGVVISLAWLLGQPERREFFFPAEDVTSEAEPVDAPDPDAPVLSAPDLAIPPPTDVASRPRPPSLSGEDGAAETDEAAVVQDPGPDRPATLLPNQPSPRYPANARFASGEVVLRVIVDVNGFPRRVDIDRSSGTRALDRSAVDAVRRWRFDPARRDGEPVESTLLIPIAFQRD